MSQYTDATQKAQEYYNSEDAQQFYFNIWGGEDIHVGLYESEDEPIANASRRTVARMLKMLPPLDKNSQVIDFGAGFGGAARQMVKETGCYVVCLNLSEKQNELNRQKNREAGLEDRIEVIDGTFETVPKPDEVFDVVWSEDSILHASDREKVLREAYRVLKPGGSFIFTDPMQREDCPENVLQPIYDRINLDSLATFSFYRNKAKEIGFEEVEIVDLSEQLPRHYGRVKQDLLSRKDDILKVASEEYVDNMLKGLQHWVDGGQSGYLAWGILHFRKRGA